MGTRLVAALEALLACCLLISCTSAPGGSGANQTPAAVAIDLGGLLGAPVPSLCEHPAGNLVDGSLPGLGENEGQVFLRLDALATARNGTPSDALAIGTDPSAAVAAVVSCDRGGVNWPDAVVIWNDALDLMAWVDLRRTEGSRGYIHAVELSGTELRIKWTYAGAEDPACCGTYSAQGRAEISRGGELDVESITVSRGEDLVRSALAVSSDRGGSETSASAPPDKVSEQARQAVNRVIDLGVSFDTDALECRGGALKGGTYKERELPIQRSPVACWVPLGNGEIMLFGLYYEAWNDYRIVSAYVI
jgi:lipoprotein